MHIYIYHIRQNFQGGKLSWLFTKHTIHWKTFAVHQAHAIMYCTWQVIQGENFHDWLKTAKTAKVLPLKGFAVYGKYDNIQIFNKFTGNAFNLHIVVARCISNQL